MIIEILLFFILLGGLFYRWLTKSFDKWAKLGIPHDKPSFPSGTHNILAAKKHINDFAAEDYKKYKIEQNHKIHGWFLLGKPALSINDPELIKQIQVKDFNHFVDRNESNMTKAIVRGGDLDKLWGKALDSASGDQWKDIRSTFTPIFTSGKMKAMLTFIKETSKAMTNDLENKANDGVEFELKETFGKFSLDSLASCAFGVNAQSFTNEKSVFVKYAANVLENTAVQQLLFFIKLIPGVVQLHEIFNINTFQKTATQYFRDVILTTLKTRRESGVRMNDLIDLMLDCIKSGEQVEESDDGKNQYDKDMEFSHKKTSRVSDDEIVATAMVFLVAGYDTTGMTLSMLAYAMANNPDMQERLQQEVDRVFEDNGGELPDYNTIQGMQYLDMLIYETLRFYNPVGFNTRSCTSDYRLPGTDITVKKDDLITWSVTGLHMDPEHFSHPDEFYPDHFSKEEKAARHPYAFQAFGQGPRSCIGMRFALLEAKVAILSVWRRFSFLPGTKTILPLVIDPEASLSWAKGGVWANIVHRTEM